MSNEKHEHIGSAMAKAWAAMPKITRDAQANITKTHQVGYATLEHIMETIRPTLVANGLWISQPPSPHDAGVCVRTVLHHESGEWLDLGSVHIPADKMNAQAFGSAMTYARRYGILSALGMVADDDDDGRAANLAPKQSDTVLNVKGRIFQTVRGWGFDDSEVKSVVLKARTQTAAPDSVEGWRCVEDFLSKYDGDSIMDFLNGGGSAAEAMNGAAAKATGGRK